MKRSKLILCLLLAVCFVCAIFVACSTSIREEDLGDEYTFTNPDDPHAETDAGVTVDGKLTEEFWSGKRQLKNIYNGGEGDTVTVESTAHFGEKGVYLGIEVEDHNVNYNENREVFYNSGMEIYFASGDISNAVDGAYRFIVNAGGATLLQRYSGGSGDGYSPQFFAWDVMPFAGIELQGGAIGSGSCTGYNVELFIPYGVFGETAPDSVWMNIALLRAYTSDAYDENRTWYSFGENEIGAQWTVCSSWYEMDAGGLVAHDLTIECGEGGTVTSPYDYVLNGKTVQLTIQPNEGYRLKSLTVNGADVTDSITVDSSGNAVYTSGSITQDVAVKAEFEQVSSESFTLKGGITFAGGNSEELWADIDRVELFYAGSVYAGTISADDGTYRVTAPAGTYKLRLYSKAGYLIKSVDVSLTQDLDRNVEVSAEEWGADRIMYFADATLTGGRETLYSGTLESGTFAYSAFLGIGNGHHFMDTQYCVVDIFFTFSNGTEVDLQLLNWNYRLVIKNAATSKETNLSSAIDTLQRANGGAYVTVFFNEEGYSVWMDGGDGTFAKVFEETLDLEGAKQIQLSCKGADGIGAERPFEHKDARLGLNKTTMEGLYPNIVPEFNVSSDACEVTGLQDSYKYGETVTFELSLDPGYEALVTLNGNTLTANEGEYSFTASVMNNVEVSVYRPGDSATLTGIVSSDFDLEGATLHLDGDEDFQTQILAGNAYEFDEIAVGRYTAYVELHGVKVELGSFGIYGTAAEADFELTNVTTSNGGIADPVEGSVIYKKTAGDLDAYRVNGINLNGVVYLRSVWKTSQEVLDGHTAEINGKMETSTFGIGFSLSNGDFFIARLLNESGNSPFIQVVSNNWSHWGPSGSVPLDAWMQARIVNEGLEVVVRFDTATGAYELFVIGESGPVSVGYGNSSYNTSGGAAYISGIYTHAWGETEYSMSGIEFIDGMDSYYEGKPVTLDVKYTEGEAVITGLEESYTYGDEISFTVTAASGYKIMSVTVNGTPLAAGSDGAYTYSGVCGLTFTVEIVTASETVTEGAVSGEVDSAFDLEGVTLRLDGENDYSVAIGADNQYSFDEVAVGEYDAYVTLFGTEFSVGKVSVISAQNTPTLELTSIAAINGGTADPASGTVSVETPTGDGAHDTDIFTASGLSLTGEVYMRSVWKTTEEVLNSEVKWDAPGFAIIFQMSKDGKDIGGQPFMFRYCKDGDPKAVFQIIWNSWAGNQYCNALTEEMKAALIGEGLEVIAALDSEAGTFVLYVMTESGAVKMVDWQNDFLKGVTITGFTAHGWQYASFSMSGIEFADSMDSFFEGTVVVPSADYTQSEAKIEGLAAEYTYGDDVAFTVSALQGYRIVSVTVNGAALTAETDGTYKYSGKCGLELNVVVVTAEASVTAGTVTGSIDCAFDLEGVAITLVGESEISGTVGADNAISMQDVPLGEYTAYITLFGARVSAGTVSVTAAENTASLSYNGQLNGAAYDIASGTVSYEGNGTEGGTDVFAFDGLTFTEKTYIKGVWKLSAETADVAGVGAGIYLRNSAGAIVFRYYYDAGNNNQFFQVTDWSYWGGSPDGTAKPGTDIHTCLTGDGLNVAIEFDPQAGSYVLYVDTGSGWQSIAQATIGGKAGCTFTGIAVTAWNNVDFTISDLEITSALE